MDLFKHGRSSAADPASPPPVPAAPKRKKRWIKWIIIALIAVLAAALILRACLPQNQNRQAMSEAVYQYETVSRRDITDELSYSGTLEPADSYNVTALVSGEILEAPFEEGDVLEEGAALYTIDTDNAQNSIDQAELSLEQAQMSYDRALESLENLNVTAPASGTVISLDVEPGDEVQAGQQLGSLRDSTTVVLRIPFNAADAAAISAGDTASITVDGSFETLSGTVTKVSGADEILSGGMIVRYVTIEAANPGAIAADTSATAVVNGIACNSAGTFSYKAEETITAEASGTVVSVTADEGSWVNEGGTILTLESDDLSESLRNSEISLENAQLSLENAQEQLDNYQITSPIAGTVIQKNYKAGDTLGSSSAGTLCTIYDLSYLTMTLNVDELDISDIEVGQRVTITADAVEGQTYEGEVTAISVQGTTSGGVTTYPVTIRIDETDGLLPGMNVDAQIVIESAEQVLTVPAGAVERGNRVLVSTESETGKAALAAQEESGAAAGDAPEGYVYVEVTLGVSDGDYIEILSGLSEGDEIAYMGSAGSAYSGSFDMMGGMEMGGFGGAVTISPGEGMPAGGGGPGGGMGGR